MATLLGRTSEGTGATIAAAAEIGWGFKFTGLATGKAEALHVTISTELSTATKLNMAIQKSAGGKPEETPLIEATITNVTKGSHEVALPEPFTVEIKSGTEYWITLVGEDGTWKFKQGAETASAKTGANKSKKLSGFTTAQWAAEETKGPVAVWVTGTEGAGEPEPKLKAVATKSVSGLDTPKLSVTEATVKLLAVAITEESGLIEDFLGGQTPLTAESVMGHSGMRSPELSEPGGGGKQSPFGRQVMLGTKHHHFEGNHL